MNSDNLRRPQQPAALAGIFTDYKTVKTRSAFQVIIEVPIERQAEVFAVLGYPMPGTDIHVAIARLTDSPVGAPFNQAEEHPTPALIADRQTRPDEAPAPAGERSRIAREHYAAASDMEKALIRSAMLPKDEQFQRWCGASSQPEAIAFIRHRIGGSRSAIAEDVVCYKKFVALETDYRIDTGQMAEIR